MIPIGPQGFKITIDRALETNQDLKVAYDNEEDTRKILDLAKKLEGVARQYSTHAAGVVIGDRELTDYTPLQFDSKKEKIITQYDMRALDLNAADNERALGLLKMDFLGLRNLTILSKSAEFVQATEGKKIDISEIPLDDEKVYKMISAGETTGVFQLESAGMRRVARQLKPNRFSDISAMVALFRPGPMEWINEFIAGKNDPSRVHYLHKDLKDILSETYGVAVYQEQCLQIAVDFAGFNWGEADGLRRAIGKKKRKIMERQKVKFIKGAMKKGYKKEIAERVFSLIERFVGYGFNKAHSTSYAMIAYQTGWMKVNYPVEFMAAFLTAEAGNTDKVALGVEECRRMGIKVFSPDINTSQVGFSIEDTQESLNGKGVRFGLSAIKNVGKAAIEAILKARELGGDFSSLSEFCQRVDSQKVNKKVVESLIKVGAMDRFGPRAAMLTGFDRIRARSEVEQRRRANGQMAIFDQKIKQKKTSPKDELPEIEDFSRSERLNLERSLLGFYLSEHPLTSVMALIGDEISHKIYELSPELMVNERVKIGGMVTSTRIVLTRNGGAEMAFASIEDGTGKLEVVVFPRVYETTRPLWIKDQMVLVEGRLDSREDNLNLLVENVQPISAETKANEKYDFKIQIPRRISSSKLVQINKLLKSAPGKDRGVLIFNSERGKKKLALTFGVKYGKRLEKKIREIIKS